MGLDMFFYLKKNEYKSKWKNSVMEYPPAIEEIVAECDREDEGITETTKYNIGYLRKANAIHKWFVDVCADGVDDCRDIDVSVDDLEELKNLCNEILVDHSKAQELLPCQEGFFFGSQEYGEWYFNDLKYMSELLSKTINFLKTDEGMKNYTFVYGASW